MVLSPAAAPVAEAASRAVCINGVFTLWFADGDVMLMHALRVSSRSGCTLRAGVDARHARNNKAMLALAIQPQKFNVQKCFGTLCCKRNGFHATVATLITLDHPLKLNL